MRNMLFSSFLFLVACPGPRGGAGDGTSQAITNGLNGSNGIDGQSIVGPQGPTGLPGRDGLDATPVTWIQFCSGTTTYPSTFVEGGFCINGNVYAVYSANDGFLTYIPPGTYSSNAINSRCTFNLLANCVIQ